jgi:PKD repeat protein
MASSSHEEAGFETFDVSAARGALVAGTNVLALEGHNFTLGSPDFWLDLELVPTLSSSGGTGNPPIARIDGVVATANAPATIAFSAALSRDPDGAPLSAFLWDFGDGTSGRGKRVQHTYVSDGTYTVTLGVRDRERLDGLATRTVTIHSLGTAPLVQLRASATQVSHGTSVAFDSAGSLDADGGALYAYWDFGDPTSAEANHSTAASASHVFAAAGTYVVTLAITDDEASTATRTLTITVN